MSDLGSEGLVVHQQEVQLVHIVHEELFEAVGQQVASLLVAPVTNLKVKNADLSSCSLHIHLQSAPWA